MVAIGLDFDDTIRSEPALKRWSKGAGKQVEQIVEGQTQDDPDVKAEMQLIENAILKVDTIFMAKYGGVQGASKRFIALRNLPKSKVEPVNTPHAPPQHLHATCRITARPSGFFQAFWLES